ncbi:MAG: prepilin-type N-terminal cleavage/methylation domain-containing protein [Kiritimatiellae bacterium]|nr:prepilin-type N-terminal cleavage/methylation domain-containing protein [Kiritimatiellia bacterium]
MREMMRRFGLASDDSRPRRTVRRSLFPLTPYPLPLTPYPLPLSSPRAAFTLVELLITIGIIAVLAGLLIPTVNTVLRKAEETEARADVKAIATAVQAYVNEYGRFPEGSGGPDRVFHHESPANANNRVINPLRSVVSNYGNKNGINNPRNIVFLEVAADRIATSGMASVVGSYVDPWDWQYRIVLDLNYDNMCDANSPQAYVGTNRNVIVWSIGRDGSHNTADDIKSW